MTERQDDRRPAGQGEAPKVDTQTSTDPESPNQQEGSESTNELERQRHHNRYGHFELLQRGPMGTRIQHAVASTQVLPETSVVCGAARATVYRMIAARSAVEPTLPTGTSSTGGPVHIFVVGEVGAIKSADLLNSLHS